MGKSVVLSPIRLESGLWQYRLTTSEFVLKSLIRYTSQELMCEGAREMCRRYGLTISLTLSGVESVS